jgi:glucosamine-6-phosphate deaminase
MDVRIYSDAETASRAAAAWVADFLRRRPKGVLGLTGGRTPVPFHRELVRLHRSEALSFRRVTTFNLDEYAGIDRRHPAAFARALAADLLDLVDIPAKNTFAPRAGGEAAYEKRIRAAGGIDLQFLGIGPDGHVGFNAPGCSLGARTHVTPLTRQGYAEAGERFRGLDQPAPRHGVTMGMATIQAARGCLMLAFGAGKARAVAEMVEGAISAAWPASALQLHPSVVVFLDEAAAATLRCRDAYAWAAAAETAGQPRMSLPPAGAGGGVCRSVSRRGRRKKPSKEKR